jgi:hypothetical protein
MGDTEDDSTWLIHFTYKVDSDILKNAAHQNTDIGRIASYRPTPVVLVNKANTIVYSTCGNAQ